MQDVNTYFELTYNPKTNKVNLIEKSDRSEYTSSKFANGFLRWNCSYHSNGCDSFFKTNIDMTKIIGVPHLLHSNHDGRRGYPNPNPLVLYRHP